MPAPALGLSCQEPTREFPRSERAAGTGARKEALLRITLVQGAFLPVPPRLGGAVEKAWYAMGREFARAGHRVVHVGRSFHELPEREFDAGVHYVRVGGYAAPRSLWRLKARDLAFTLKAMRVLPPADILVANTFWLPFLERRASRGRPYVHMARFPKGQSRFYPKRCVIQTVSSPIRDALLAEVPEAGERIPVLPYPVSPMYLTPLNPHPRKEVLFTGRLHPEKGIHLLIEAFARVARTSMKGWTLRIIGPWRTEQGGGGEAYRSGLQRQMAAAGEARVVIEEPMFDEAKLVDAYHAAAFFVYPSLAEKGETFGLAVLEAMAAGCAPVVSDLACFRDFVTDEEGLRFDHRAPDAVEQLAAKMARLATEPDRLRALRQAAHAKARDYALEPVAARYLDDFRRHLER